jgi:hypothetical protein
MARPTKTVTPSLPCEMVDKIDKVWNEEDKIRSRAWVRFKQLMKKVGEGRRKISEEAVEMDV